MVTGASRGIGAAIARRLAAEGARVVVNYRRSAADAERVVAEIRAAGGWAEAAQADVADVVQVEALVDGAAESLASAGSRLDVLVSNAGVIEPAPLDHLDEGQFDRQFAANVKSVLFGARAAARAFENRGGAIINVSSISSRMPVAGTSIYSATKAAVEAITVALALELGARGVRVNAVAPGATVTDMLRSVLPAEMETATASRTALGRLGTPDDIAKVVAFLASDDAGWITGEVITASGGLR